MQRFSVQSWGLGFVLALAGYVGFSSPACADDSMIATLGLRLPEVKLQGVSFKDSIDFLRDVSNANIEVNWKALEAAGISQDSQVNMRVKDVSLRRSLSLLLSNVAGGTPLTWYTDQGVIEITTRELADKQLLLRIYPVEDLLMEIPDFNEVPTFDLTATASGGSSGRGGGGGGGGRSGGGGGSGNGGLFGNNNSGQNAEKTKTKQERADELVKLIMETIRPEIWKDNGGPASVRYYNGVLIVNAPRSVHEALVGN